jgi:hypothetical protein
LIKFFGFIQYIGVGRYEYIGHYIIIFAWGLRCGCTLKMTGSLLTVELSSCDCLGLKSEDKLSYAPNRTRTHVSRISCSLTAQYLTVRKLTYLLLEAMSPVLHVEGLSDTSRLQCGRPSSFWSSISGCHRGCPPGICRCAVFFPFFAVHSECFRINF